MHEVPNKKNETWHLANKLWRYLKWNDGAHVLHADKSEAGTVYIPDRGFDINQNTPQGEYTPEYVHHNYLHTDEYVNSRERRGKTGANSGEFLERGKFSGEDKWF
jgi:hypothetical protein